MVALAATNAVGVVLFGALYLMAGLRYLSQGPFIVCLAILFAVVTRLWLRVEARHQGLAPARRLGRVAAALAAVVIAVPVTVLMPVFWLDQQLPAEAGFHARRAPVMALILISLALTVLVNVVGGVVIAARTARARRGA